MLLPRRSGFYLMSTISTPIQTQTPTITWGTGYAVIPQARHCQSAGNSRFMEPNATAHMNSSLKTLLASVGLERTKYWTDYYSEPAGVLKTSCWRMAYQTLMRTRCILKWLVAAEATWLLLQ